MAPVLQTQGLVKQFGGIIATNDVSLSVEKGARHALIGPNGAGKTTVINLLTGVLRPTAGRILLEGRDITDLEAYKRVALGLARTFQINQLFAELTPLETIGLAVSERMELGRQWWRLPGSKPIVIEESVDILNRFSLTDVMNERTATLPYGKQRLLEIALAIACRPNVLLLDEPAAGVPEAERHGILNAVAGLPSDVTVLLIEHDMDIVFSFADRISVLVNGELFVEGTPEEVAQDPRVKAVYLGEEAHDACQGPQEFLDNDRGQALERLVQQQQPRVQHQRPADCEHLLLSTGQLDTEVAFAFGEPRKKLVDAHRCPRPGTRDGSQVFVDSQ